MLFDQNIAKALRKFTPKHLTRTADEMGWSRLQNGHLLSAAENDGFEVFVTADKSIRYQQNLRGRKIAIIELSTNDWTVIREQPSLYVDAVNAAKAGSYRAVEFGPEAPRRRRGPHTLG